MECGDRRPIRVEPRDRQSNLFRCVLRSPTFLLVPTAAVKRDIDVVSKMTNRNFAVNHIPPTLDADAFRYTLAARPAVISFALGDPS